jgi:hypothetical protein
LQQKQLLNFNDLINLSYSIKLHFFKTFILPHFDNCSSLFIYFSNTLLENIEGLYNNCLFHLLDLDFRGKPKDKQYEILKPLNLLPSKYRILFRFSTFYFNILNKIILKDFFGDLKLNLNVKNTRCKTRNIFNVPRSLTVKSGKRLSIYLPQLVNKVIKYSHYLEFKDFKQYILFNIFDLF